MDELQDLFDKIKRAFESDEQKKKRKEKEKLFSKEEKKLNDVLDKMDMKWREDHTHKVDYEKMIKPDIGLDKKKHLMFSYDDIKNIANKKYEDKYRNDKRNIIKRNLEDYNDTKKYIENAYAKERDELIALRDKLNNARRNAKGKLLKNGMTTSSIAKGVDKELDAIERLGSEKIRDNTRRKTDSKKAEMDRLNIEKELALRDLELKKANSIDEEIRRLEKEYEKLNNSITEYNNKVDDREARYDITRKNTIEDMKRQDRVHERYMEDMETYNGYTGEKESNYNSRMQLAYALYSQLPKKEAIARVKNNARLRLLLGNNYGLLLNMLKMAE